MIANGKIIVVSECRVTNILTATIYCSRWFSYGEGDIWHTEKK